MPLRDQLAFSIKRHSPPEEVSISLLMWRPGGSKCRCDNWYSSEIAPMFKTRDHLDFNKTPVCVRNFDVRLGFGFCSAPHFQLEFDLSNRKTLLF